MTNLPTEVARLKRELAQVKKGQRLSHGASIEDAAIEVRDSSGSLRAIVGQQGDGTTGAVIVNGPPPPSPSAPIVASVLGGVTASWDGLFADGAVIPLDWARLEVHASTAPDFTPDPVTLQNTIETAQGATVVIPCENDVYVRFLARSTSGTPSDPSVTVGPFGPAPVVSTELLDGIVTTVKLADDAVTQAKVAVGAIGTTEISDSAITTPKIVAGAVQTAQLDAEAVNASKIAAGAVTTTKLDALAVTADKLAVNAVIAGKIDAGAVDATAIKAGSITADRMAIVGGTNLLPDPSFEGAAGAALVAGETYWSIAATGNNSAKSVQVDSTNPTAVIRTLTLAVFPTLAGQEVYLATDVKPSSDWVGASVRIYVRWIDSAGGATFGIVQSTSPTLGVWQTISGTVKAPTGTVSTEVRLASYNATIGAVQFDNVVVQPVMSKVQIGDGAITADKLEASAITGKTITGGSIIGTTVTGAIVRTGTTGSRLLMGPDAGGTNIPGLALYSGAAAETQPGLLWSTVTTVGTATQPTTVVQAPYVDSGSALLQLTSPATGQGGQFKMATSSTKDYAYIFAKDGSTSGASVLELWAQNGASGGSSVLQVKGTEIYLRSAAVTVNGPLTAGNHAFGATTVTPSAAHTPAGVTVVYNVTGTTFYGQATANTTVPGVRTPVGAQGVTGVGVSGATATSMMVWVNRENTTSTNVNWEVWSS